MRTAALILAAGTGTRLGRGPKALLPWEGSVLVVRAAQVAVAAGCVPVVTTGESEPIGSWLTAVPQSVQVVVPGATMADSFRAGVARAAATGAQRVLVMTVDQPDVDEPVLTRLLAVHRLGRVTRAGYAGTPGHPVLWDTPDAVAAAALARGDEGGRAWLRAHDDVVDLVPCEDLATGADVDTPADLRRWPGLGR